MQIEYKGYDISINEDLLDQQNAWVNIKDIIWARIWIQNILEADHTDKHKEYLNKLTGAEFALQRAWNFEEDINKHSYQWKALEECLCPKMDNLDNLGCDTRYIIRDCPYHGGEVEC